tara:strand:- start:1824 stop:2813 length:990 start_codon:yes stop_codon:yes gene_type:complete
MIYKSYIIEKDINNLDNKIFLFYGENLGLKNDLKKKIKINNTGKEFVNLSQQEILKDKDYFIGEISNLSLFNEYKFFLVEDTNDKFLDLLKEIENKNDNNKFFLFADILDKKSKLRNYCEKSKNIITVACYQDNELTLKNKISKELKGYSGLTPLNMNIILENCSLDRSKLENEINKILTFFDNKIIETEKLEKLLNIKINEDFNRLKDEALNGDKIKTNKLLSETLLEPDKNILYLNFINQRLLKLAEVMKSSTKISVEDAMSKLKPPIFWKDKPFFLKQLKSWNLAKINKMLDETYNLEVLIKTNSSINHSIMIKNLILRMCNLANS